MEKIENNIKQCSECKSTFIRQSDMLRHIKRFHKSKADKLIAAIENQDRRFKCKQCNKRFFHKKNLHFHEKSHDANNSGVKIRKKCPFCVHVAVFKKDFYSHCQDAHNITLNFERIEFANVDDFLKWKMELETSLHCEFLREYGSTAKITNYVCNQSKLSDENEVVESTTDKIDGFCPAGMKVMHDDSGKCSIIFVKTHICHQNRNYESSKQLEKDAKNSIKPVAEVEEDSKVMNLQNAKPKNNSKNNKTKDVAQPDVTLKKKLPKVATNTSRKNFLNKKKEMIHNVIATLNNINNMAELEAVQELVNPIKPIMEILRKKTVRGPKPKLETVKSPKQKLETVKK